MQDGRAATSPLMRRTPSTALLPRVGGGLQMSGARKLVSPYLSRLHFPFPPTFHLKKSYAHKLVGREVDDDAP